MWKIILSVLFTVSATGLSAQVKKIYGYSQAINGGARYNDDLPGSRSGTGNENSRYFIFVEIEKGKRIVFEELWINGHSYNYKKDTTRQLPYVIRTSNGGDLIFTDTLVRSAKGQVIQFKDLVRTDAVITKNTRRFVTKTNAVIFFRYKGKLQYMGLKKLKPLRPLFTQ